MINANKPRGKRGTAECEREAPNATSMAMMAIPRGRNLKMLRFAESAASARARFQPQCEQKGLFAGLKKRRSGTWEPQRGQMTLLTGFSLSLLNEEASGSARAFALFRNTFVGYGELNGAGVMKVQETKWHPRRNAPSLVMRDQTGRKKTRTGGSIGTCKTAKRFS